MHAALVRWYGEADGRRRSCQPAARGLQPTSWEWRNRRSRRVSLGRGCRDSVYTVGLLETAGSTGSHAAGVALDRAVRGRDFVSLLPRAHSPEVRPKRIDHPGRRTPRSPNKVRLAEAAAIRSPTSSETEGKTDLL